ncbi:unnamed protein product [Clonostachys rosea]|uniref:RRM domain-containing protein n=1 Tax=Bionectria ochroleuca TaxID=29856 RepID=A0ABY6UV65_BIOOC|nr:unnamed protein product [Clonostachys rosea]
MAYPPPPGTSNLPARPPPSNDSNNGGSGGFTKGGFKPSFSAGSASLPQLPYARTASPYTGANAIHGPVGPPQSQYGPTSYTSYSGPGTVNAPPSYSSSYQRQAAPSRQPQGYNSHAYSQPPSSTSYAAPPSIKNPFPLPGASGTTSDYDPEAAAQYAQWQSAYVTRDPVATGKDGKPVVTAELPKPEQAPANPDKKKTVVREGGGEKWTDDTLLEWDQSHLRLFVGNLAGETTDDSLFKAFSRWGSLQKSRVVRDKRTNKSKGYGFVSFSDADDFFQAAKEMNGKYIQSHPVVVRKAKTEIKVTNAKDKDKGRHKNNKKNHNAGNGNGGGGNGGGGYEPNLGPHGGATKIGKKTKNGLRLLG